jgi:phage repressor protein C with HTH and peptisase S24 domain
LKLFLDIRGLNIKKKIEKIFLEMPSDAKKKKEQQKKEARKKSSRKPNAKQNEENDNENENENTSLNGDDGDENNGVEVNGNGHASSENGNVDKAIKDLQKKFVNFELIEKSNAENRSCTGKSILFFVFFFDILVC